MTWDEAIERFRAHADEAEAAAVYLSLLAGAQERWQTVVEVHD